MSNRGDGETRFTVADEAGLRFLKGVPGQQLMRTVGDATLAVEACLSQIYAPFTRQVRARKMIRELRCLGYRVERSRPPRRRE